MLRLRRQLVGQSRPKVVTTDRYGCRFSGVLMFEMVEVLPTMIWQAELFE